MRRDGKVGVAYGFLDFADALYWNQDVFRRQALLGSARKPSYDRLPRFQALVSAFDDKSGRGGAYHVRGFPLALEV